MNEKVVTIEILKMNVGEFCSNLLKNFHKTKLRSCDFDVPLVANGFPLTLHFEVTLRDQTAAELDNTQSVMLKAAKPQGSA